jgi:hypothetical protein
MQRTDAPTCVHHRVNANAQQNVQFVRSSFPNRYKLKCIPTFHLCSSILLADPSMLRSCMRACAPIHLDFLSSPLVACHLCICSLSPSLSLSISRCRWCTSAVRVASAESSRVRAQFHTAAAAAAVVSSSSHNGNDPARQYGRGYTHAWTHTHVTITCAGQRVGSGL